MSKETPDHHDVELAFHAYELRREAVMRESRNAMNREFWPKTYPEVLAVLKAEHPLNAPWRQTTTYWEMVYGAVKHGAVHPEYFMESNGEGMFLFARVAPYLEQFRKDYGPHAFQNAEWVSKNTENGKRLFAMFSERVRKALEAK